MKLTPDQMKSIISALKEGGYEVGVRDICYVLLCRSMEESVYAYKALFNQIAGSEPFEKYSVSDRIEELTLYVDRNFPEDKPEKPQVIEDEEKKASSAEGENLSFDEIKKGLEEDLASLVMMRDQVDADGNPLLEPKDMASVVGRIAAVRVALVEKFGSSQENVEQRIVIAPKYTDICPNCGHEVAIDPTHKKLF